MRLECDVFNSIYEQLGPKCPFFKWIDNLTCMRGNEAAHLVQQKLDLLRSELQLAHERERATQAVAEATQMAKIAQDKAAKATERERKFRASSVQVKEIAVRALEQKRKCRIALILSWFFFLFWLCCFHVLTQVRMLE